MNQDRLLSDEELQTKALDVLIGYKQMKLIPERPGVKPLTLREASKEILDLINTQKRLYAQNEKREFANDVKAKMVGKLDASGFAQLREALRAESED